MKAKTYSEKLRDPRWQRRRLELFEKAGWTCAECKTKTETLHAHHGYYKRNTDPWDYPDNTMHVLCSECHSEVQGFLEQLHERIAVLDKFKLFLMHEFLSSLNVGIEETVWTGVHQENAINSFLYIANAAVALDDLPKERIDFKWLMAATMDAAMDHASQEGYEMAQYINTVHK